MSLGSASMSLDSSTTVHEEPGVLSEIFKQPTDVGKEFLKTRSSPTQEKIEADAALWRGRLGCTLWLHDLATEEMDRGQKAPLSPLDGKIPEPAESTGHKPCSVARQLTQSQMAEDNRKLRADEYSLALSWEVQHLLKHRKVIADRTSVQSQLFELPTGYAVEISVGKRLIEQRHLVEDLVDDIRENHGKYVDPDRVKFLAARHSSEQCFVCEKLAA